MQAASVLCPDLPVSAVRRQRPEAPRAAVARVAVRAAAAVEWAACLPWALPVPAWPRCRTATKAALTRTRRPQPHPPHQTAECNCRRVQLAACGLIAYFERRCCY